jgi:hypothetical protein
MKTSENAGSSWSTRMIVVFSSMIVQSVIALTVAIRRGCPARHVGRPQPGHLRRCRYDGGSERPSWQTFVAQQGTVTRPG